MFLELLSSKLISSLLLLSIAVSSLAYLYLTIDPQFESEIRVPRQLRSSLKSSEKVDLDLQPIINSAEKVWSIINDNRARSEIQSTYGSALPENVHGKLTVENWHSPGASHSFFVDVYNGLKQNVLHFTFTLQYNYGGSIDGKGQYLDRVTIVPSKVYVAWAFVFNASVEITSVHNVGTIENPKAALNINLFYRLSGLNVVERTETFQVIGDGSFLYLNA